jgi:hypothetical protein
LFWGWAGVARTLLKVFKGSPVAVGLYACSPHCIAVYT